MSSFSSFLFIPCDSLPQSSSYSLSSFFTSSFHKVSCFSTSRTNPVSSICRKVSFLQCEKSFRRKPFEKRPLIATASNKMTITEYRDEEEENPPLLLESEMKEPRRIALFVEPSPFAYVSGYKNRFQNFIKYLREMGDEVYPMFENDVVSL
ncbi:hypothetical protein HAX54_015263 [Datura stramonium]|uniref:Uncharacterized protein n=1 Tax=Datura stramonium TaxID=4076 RepID=A0ABS8RZF6_DATST|nr:hypothetical protein [Datura stramonium]